MHVVEQAIALYTPEPFEIEQLTRPINREAWLAHVAEKLRSQFEELGWTLPPPSKLAYAVGFPSKNARSRRNRRVGECWDPRTTPDGTIHILVSPVIGDAVEAAGILVHELIHAAIGGHHGHNKTFQRAATKLGLEGKPTATTVGSDLRSTLDRIIQEVGPYPHQPLSFVPSEKKKSANRQKKVTCPVHSEFLVRMSRKTYKELGAPQCGMCSTAMEMEEEDEDEVDTDE